MSDRQKLFKALQSLTITIAGEFSLRKRSVILFQEKERMEPGNFCLRSNVPWEAALICTHIAVITSSHPTNRVVLRVNFHNFPNPPHSKFHIIITLVAFYLIFDHISVVFIANKELTKIAIERTCKIHQAHYERSRLTNPTVVVKACTSKRKKLALRLTPSW